MDGMEWEGWGGEGRGGNLFRRHWRHHVLHQHALQQRKGALEGAIRSAEGEAVSGNVAKCKGHWEGLADRKFVICFSSRTRNRSFTSWNFSFSSSVTVPTPSGLGS
jgi:hypothetical protein